MKKKHFMRKKILSTVIAATLLQPMSTVLAISDSDTSDTGAYQANREQADTASNTTIEPNVNSTSSFSDDTSNTSDANTQVGQDTSEVPTSSIGDTTTSHSSDVNSQVGESSSELPISSAEVTTTNESSEKSEESLTESSFPLYRLYNPGLKVHLYTKDRNEYNTLSQRGWKQENIAWNFSQTNGELVYRLYHPGLKVHLYTKDRNEYNVLASRGWKQEGEAFRSFGSLPIYRLYHTGLQRHLYTKDSREYSILASRGWKQEGIAFYGIGSASTNPPEEPNTPPITTPTITIDKLVASLTTQGIQIQLTAPDNTDFSKVKIAVWSEANGQDDIQWYTPGPDGKVLAAYSKHKDYEKYQIHVYSFETGSARGLTTSTIEVPKPSASISVKKVDALRYNVHVSSLPTYITEVNVPVWSQRNGQDDIKWWPAKKQADGSYVATVSVADHNLESGSYSAHVYGNSLVGNNKQVALAATNFTVNETPSSTGELSISAVNHSDYTFTAHLKNVAAKDGVKSIKIAVWTDEKGQDDIEWLTTFRNPDGSYSAITRLSSHSYANGLYHVHAYIETNKGQTIGIASKKNNCRYQSSSFCHSRRTKPNPGKLP
ncbi:autolysin [Streptococcus varani]|uniref:Autolysin n=2 Tax=Streptococcus varani TaxID=1608583 RepID=A0A0E4H5E7_9STRE|nr:autolysin [Streptococcus varani]